ncbi:MAG: PRC-barrel domain-containing protein [Thermomicrobiales bacterium]
MNSKDVKGISVIAIADGRNTGKVSHVFFDPGARKVVGFAAAEGQGFLRPKTSEEMIDAHEIHSLGPDALTLKNADEVAGSETTTAMDHLIDAEELNKRQVVTEAGTLVGTVSSIDFDPKSFDLLAFEVSAGLLKSHRMVSAADIMTIGADTIVVRNSVETAPAEAGEAGRFVVGDVDPTP